MFYTSLLKIAMWKTLTSHLKALSKQQTPNRTKKETQPKLTPSPLPSRRTSTTATQIAGAERFQGRKGSRRALCFLLWVVSSFACPNPHHNTHWSRTISKKKSSSELGNKLAPPWATIQRFVFHDFPFSPIWISNWVFGFFVCFIGKFQIWAFPFLWEQRVGFDMIWGLFGFWIRDVWLIWLS